MSNLQHTATETVTASRSGLSLDLFNRVRDSLRSPTLVGEGGARVRYLRVQWWVTFWRFLILLQIPEVTLVQPDRFESLPRAYILMAAAAAYAAVNYLIATRTRAGGKLVFHLVDLGVCSALLLLAAGDDKLLFVMTFYSFSSLLARPTVLFREMVPATAALSISFLAAYWLQGQSPRDLLASPSEIDSFMLYFFFGLGFVGFSAVLQRASSLELDSHLEEQRQRYRRHLHDDLGNTLCGLHFRIQSLRQISESAELGRALRFLADGYGRAASVLSRLLSGLEDTPVDNLTESLIRLKDETDQSGGPSLRLLIPVNPVRLSPEVGREVMAVISEAVNNAKKHAGVSEINLRVRKRLGKLRITVSDEGDGFDDDELQVRQSAGSKGIKGMYERAALIKGRLEIESGKRHGTRVTLKVDVNRGNGILSRVLDYDPERSLSGIYPFLVRLRFFMLVWTLIGIALVPDSHRENLPLFAVCAGLVLDGLAWVVLSSPLFRIISKRPWLLLLESAGFSILAYLVMQDNVPYFFSLYVGVAVIMNGLFLTALKNLVMTLLLNAGIVAAYQLAPATLVATFPGGRLETPLQHSTIYVILAVSAGLAGEFVKNLESLQIKAITRVLARQRVNMTAETHRQLDSLVTGIRQEFQELSAETTGSLDSHGLKGIESRSSYLKTRLRSILISLDEPVDAADITGDLG